MLHVQVLSLPVNFRDVNFVTSGSADAEAASGKPAHERFANYDFSGLTMGVQKNKLVIIMVGLPGRGKTFLCKKLLCYLNWLGHSAKHFNVGAYRRTQKHDGDVQDASFFDHSNEVGMAARQQALVAALDDMACYLRSDEGQVAIFDATNTTHSRRSFLAVVDFKERVQMYEDVYEPIADRSMHYIKLTDMVTGRGHLDINRISGYLPGKIVFYLMQVCKAGLGNHRKIWLTRHGESEFNQNKKIGGNSPISERGEKYARCLPAQLISRLPQVTSLAHSHTLPKREAPGRSGLLHAHTLAQTPTDPALAPLLSQHPTTSLFAGQEDVSVSVWTSTLKRTIQTARGIPFPKLRWKALDEIDAGICDGFTYEEVDAKYPEEFRARKLDKLKYRTLKMRALAPTLDIPIRWAWRYPAAVVLPPDLIQLAEAHKIPTLDIPLHTLIELTPLPDGSMCEARFPIDIDNPEVLASYATPYPPLPSSTSTSTPTSTPQPAAPPAATPATAPIPLTVV
ncbi:MAG: hypothetical protein WDW38_009532 [Sanguina aurantia]